MKYWIRYTNDTVNHFEADSDKEAHHYFMMEGDHAYDYGLVQVVPPAVTGWIEVVDDKYEGQAVHRTRSGKGAVGQAIAKHKKPPNCS